MVQASEQSGTAAHVHVPGGRGLSKGDNSSTLSRNAMVPGTAFIKHLKGGHNSQSQEQLSL